MLSRWSYGGHEWKDPACVWAPGHSEPRGCLPHLLRSSQSTVLTLLCCNCLANPVSVGNTAAHTGIGTAMVWAESSATPAACSTEHPRSLHTCEPRPLLPYLPSSCSLKTLGLGSPLGSFPPFCPHSTEQCPLNMEPSLPGPGTSSLVWSFLTASSCSPDSRLFHV